MLQCTLYRNHQITTGMQSLKNVTCVTDCTPKIFIECSTSTLLRQEKVTHVTFTSMDEDISTEKPSPRIVPTKMKTKAVSKRYGRDFQTKCVFRKCRDLFSSKAAMQYHVAHLHKRGVKATFQCHLCTLISSSRESLRTHMNSVHFRI